MNPRSSCLVCVLISLFLLTLDSYTANAQGVLTNGWTYGGNILSVGDSKETLNKATF